MIVAAALRQGTIVYHKSSYWPRMRHDDIIRHAQNDQIFSMDYHSDPIEEGFVNETGTFFTRQQALANVVAQRQLVYGKEPITMSTTELYTVHLW